MRTGMMDGTTSTGFGGPGAHPTAALSTVLAHSLLLDVLAGVLALIVLIVVFVWQFGIACERMWLGLEAAGSLGEDPDRWMESLSESRLAGEESRR